MKTLVLGASGATGKLIVKQLMNKGIPTKILIRSQAKLPKEILESKSLEVINGNIDEISSEQLRELLKDCNSVVSCLGHNISLKGIMGKPHKLVFNAVRKIADIFSDSEINKKLILMSTTAYTEKSHGEKETFGERIVFSILKLILPPQADNVISGDHLFKTVKESDRFEWIAVRPDTLIDDTIVSEYEVFDRKRRSPIFNPGKTSRINVACFMADLLSNDMLWQEWKYKAPVIYNKE